MKWTFSFNGQLQAREQVVECPTDQVDAEPMVSDQGAACSWQECVQGGRIQEAEVADQGPKSLPSTVHVAIMARQESLQYLYALRTILFL